MLDGDRALRLGGAKQRAVLAILLLRAGEVISADRLVDELWGDSPPDDAAAALQQHVSRLRRALAPHEVVLTRPPGYVAELGEGELDLHEFERLRAEGRRLLDGGRPQAAGDALRQALELWRGRPLADLESQPFARDAITHLDELWLEALETRIEADLAVARHDELIAELRPLVRRHPLRERLRGQLMLALYRSGRQAEALEVYADGRRTLVDELGLEPGPELRRLHQAILDHDPALEIERPRAAPLPLRLAGDWRAVAATAALLLVAVVAVALLLTGGGDGGERARSDGGELVALDARSGKIARRVPAGRTPAAVAGVAGGRLWVVDADARTLLAIDPATGDAEALATGATPTSVAVGAGGVWVANGRPSATAQVVGPVTTQVVRLDAATRTQRAAIDLPPPRGEVTNIADNRVAVSARAVWAIAASGAVVRVEPRSSAITATTSGPIALAVAAGPAGVWVLRSDAVAAELDERSARVRRRVRLPADAATAIAVGETAAWVTSSVDGMLWRIGRGGEIGAVDVGSGAGAVAAGKHRIWVANPIAGTLTAVDPRTMRVVRRVRVGGIPRALTIDGDTLWTVVAGASAATTSRVAGIKPMPSSICEPVIVGGDGRADVLVTSDLPLQGGIRITATQMAHAMTLVLRERGFRAGRFRVAYQSCDDSVARTGLFDEAKCAANARSYAANRDVVAVIGTLNSPCAVAAVPELNTARGGPLAMVSPLNSFVGLTRQGPGIPRDLLASLYPTGRRNYLRVYPTDDLQGAALALLARDRGRRSVYVLDDGQPGYGVLMATGFRTAAQRLGLRLAGRARWDPQARSYAALARRVAASGAQAVFVGGLLDTNAARVVRDLRAHVGPQVDVMGPDGLTPLPLLVRSAGRAALGVLVSLGGVVTERLPPAGAAFVRRFGRLRGGEEIEPSAVYAAQAAQVVLDAVARSDGTRGSVLDELFRTRVRNGLLGDFGFDARGDITESPVTILRVARGGTSRRIGSVEGGLVERVSRPRAALVAE